MGTEAATDGGYTFIDYPKLSGSGTPYTDAYDPGCNAFKIDTAFYGIGGCMLSSVYDGAMSREYACNDDGTVSLHYYTSTDCSRRAMVTEYDYCSIFGCTAYCASGKQCLDVVTATFHDNSDCSDIGNRLHLLRDKCAPNTNMTGSAQLICDEDETNIIANEYNTTDCTGIPSNITTWTHGECKDEQTITCETLPERSSAFAASKVIAFILSVFVSSVYFM